MPFKIDCPFCAQRIEVPDELNNTTANCPSCNQELYLSKDDAVADAIVDRLRREEESRERQHQEHLRAVMQMQEQNRRTWTIVKWILYIFVVFPVVFWLLYAFVLFVYGCFTGKL